MQEPIPNCDYCIDPHLCGLEGGQYRLSIRDKTGGIKTVHVCKKHLEEFLKGHAVVSVTNLWPTDWVKGRCCGS
jgi:hypothetical protein